jgi:hypothetical protein
MVVGKEVPIDFLHFIFRGLSIFCSNFTIKRRHFSPCIGQEAGVLSPIFWLSATISTQIQPKQHETTTTMGQHCTSSLYANMPGHL